MYRTANIKFTEAVSAAVGKTFVMHSGCTHLELGAKGKAIMVPVGEDNVPGWSAVRPADWKPEKTHFTVAFNKSRPFTAEEVKTATEAFRSAGDALAFSVAPTRWWVAEQGRGDDDHWLSGVAVLDPESKADGHATLLAAAAAVRAQIETALPECAGALEFRAPHVMLKEGKPEPDSGAN